MEQNQINDKEITNEICKMCFGIGFLIYCVVPPKPCPRCKTKGVVKIKNWIKKTERVVSSTIQQTTLSYIVIFVKITHK